MAALLTTNRSAVAKDGATVKHSCVCAGQMAIDWELVGDVNRIDADNVDDLYEELEKVVSRGKSAAHLLSGLSLEESFC